MHQYRLSIRLELKHHRTIILEWSAASNTEKTINKAEEQQTHHILNNCWSIDDIVKEHNRHEQRRTRSKRERNRNVVCGGGGTGVLCLPTCKIKCYTSGLELEWTAHECEKKMATITITNTSAHVLFGSFSTHSMHRMAIPANCDGICACARMRVLNGSHQTYAYTNPNEFQFWIVLFCFAVISSYNAYMLIQYKRTALCQFGTCVFFRFVFIAFKHGIRKGACE